MIKPANLFLKIATKNNVIGFSNIIRPQVYDRISQKSLDTIIIYVSKKVPLSQLSAEDIIPRYYKPFLQKQLRFKIKEIGIITAPPADHQETPVSVDRTKRQDPVTLGLSIAHRTISAGSLGMSFIEQKTGDEVWGSNGHVLTPDASLRPDQIEEKRIYQPGSYHQEPTQETLIGEYHWHKQIVSSISECPVSGTMIKYLNGISNLFQRNTKLLAVSSEAKNKIDFACYKASVSHYCGLPDGPDFPGPFVGLLFAGSEQAGMICKAKNIGVEGYKSIKPEAEVKIGDEVFGSSFWRDYKTVVEDVDVSVQVQYNNGIAMFEDLILVKNEGVIKGGWSGSGWFLINTE